jgi:hypothetical protein
MITRNLRSGALVFAALLVACPPDAEAGLARSVRRVAYQLGFVEFSDSNRLTGGTEYLATNTFSGNPIEYGPYTLTLQGPLSVGYSTARRPYDALELSFGTAASGSATPSPLFYSLDYAQGNTTATVSGSLFIDGGVSVDRLGFYSVNFDVSSRKTLSNDGPYGSQLNEYDLDLGPVNVRGNVFIDAIMLVTDPIFNAADVENPFAALSGFTQLQSIIDARTSELVTLLENGVVPGTADGAIPTVGPEALRSNAAYGTLNEGGEIAFSGAIVPEPTILLLMLLGLPFVLRRLGS